MISIFLYLLGLFFNLGLIYLFFNKKSTMVLLPLGLTFLYYFPVFFDVFFNTALFSKEVVNEANFFTFFVNLNLLVFSLMFYKVCYNNAEKIDNLDLNLRQNFFKFYEGLFVVSFFLLILAVLKSTGGNIFAYSWGSRHLEGGNNIFFLLATYLYVASAGILFLNWKSGRRYKFLILILIGILFVLLIRSRGYLVPVILSFVIYFLVWKRKILFSSLIVLVFIFLFFILQQIRFLGSLESGGVIDFNVMIDNIFEQIKYGNSELSLRNVYFSFIRDYNYLEHYFNFGDFHTYLRILFFWDIFNLGLKPKDFANAMYIAYYGGNSYVQNPTMHPTLYGVIYANGMYLSSVIFSLIVVFLLWLEEVSKKKGLIFYWLMIPTFTYCIIFIARGSVNVAVIYLLVIFVFNSLIYKLIK